MDCEIRFKGGNTALDPAWLFSRKSVLTASNFTITVVNRRKTKPPVLEYNYTYDKTGWWPNSRSSRSDIEEDE